MFEQAKHESLEFIRKDLTNYASKRNFDYGPNSKNNVSNLSKYISHRIINEFELVKEILKTHTLQNTEKFIQEIFWRVYWKGWLEHRPDVWHDFVNSSPKVNKELFIEAIDGRTGISCFDDWVYELKNENYLHNHTRMWFASIWIFTLNLPWELGARFFMKYLLDGDAASNTLSWRWVAGIQTQGKNYLATEANIKKFTNNRYTEIKLKERSEPIIENKSYEVKELPSLNSNKKNNSLLMFESDLFIEDRIKFFNSYDDIFLIVLDNEHRKIKLDSKVLEFKDRLIREFKKELPNSKIISASDIDDIKNAFDCVYPNIGENLDFLNEKTSLINKINFIGRKEDLYCWQYAKKGFFNFKKQIPDIIKKLYQKELI